MRKFSEKQKLYIEAVVFGDNPVEAARKAGYKDPSNVATKFRQHRLILFAIAKGRRENDETIGESTSEEKIGDFSHISFDHEDDLLRAVQVVMHSDNFQPSHKMKALDIFAKAMGNYIHEVDEKPIKVEFFYPDKEEAEQTVRDDFGKPPPPLAFPEYEDSDLD